MCRLFLLFLLLVCLEGRGQVITLFGGGGTGGDNIPATAASLYNPGYLAFDSIGNLYITEALVHRIRKIDTHGTITTIAGTGAPGFSGDGGSATLAKINQPCGIAIDNAGNIVFADNANNRIRKIDVNSGLISTIAGNDTAGFSGDGGAFSWATLNAPGGITFDQHGNLYISDDGNARVRKVNTLGIITTVAGNGSFGWSGDGGQATAAKCSPYDIAVDNISGDLYVADYTNYAVRKINSSGVISTIAGSPASYTYNGDEIAATSAQLVPIEVEVDKNGLIFMTDYNNHRVRTIDALGIIHTVAGTGIPGYSGDGGLAKAAELNLPGGLAFDSCNNLYISQVGNARIRKVTYHESCGASLRVPDFKMLTVEIYPNPSNDILHIDILQSSTTYRLLNILGAEMQQGSLKPGNNVITLNVPSGIYMLELTDDAGKRQITKLIKQ